MARPKIEGRVRLNLAVTRVVKARMDRLQEQSEAETITELIRHALRYYEELLRVRQEGGRVVLEYPQGEKETLKVV